MRVDIGKARASRPREGFIPNPKLKLLDQVSEVMRFKHYSLRTEQTYREWIKRFILFHGKRHPREMGAFEVERFLSDLATTRRVAASTQNQAFNALLFLYREVLHQEMGELGEVERAQRPERLPTVLTKAEVEAVLGGMTGTHQLMAKLLYGTGMRLMECVRLRVKDVDFGQNQIVVREGKGFKDRVTVLPEGVKGLLSEHLGRVKLLHEKDLAEGGGRVYLPNALSRKYPAADREWGWQYVFPAANLSRDPRSGEVRRHLFRIAGVMTLLAQSAIGGTNALTPKLDAWFADYNRPGVPGASVMVIKNGKVLFAKGYGLADLEAKVPCSTNTNFRLASVTKQFTAMAVMILAERKKLSLDERLTDFFPEFPEYGRQITLRHLLTHTSGLPDYEDLIPKGTEIPVLDRDVLRLLMRQDATYFPPGSKYRYSNSAYALLALIVETRSGNTFARFLDQNIFRPLKMNHTLAYEQGLSVVPNRAYGYSPSSTGFKRTDQSLTSSVLGDGGIYSSVADLYQWDQALYTGRLVSRKMLTMAFTPGPATDQPDTGYGFGWFVGRYRGLKELWHSGNTLGFTTRISRFPEKKFGVIILTNRNEAKLAEMPHQIADLYLFASRTAPD